MPFREVGRKEPPSSPVRVAAVDFNAIDSAPAVPMFLKPIRGAADIERELATMDPRDVSRMESMGEKDWECAQRFIAAVTTAVETVMNASPERRVAALIERAAAMRCATLEGQRLLVNHIVAFATRAAEYLSRSDFAHLRPIIQEFDRDMRDAAAMAPPKPPLMPAVENAFYNAGWSSQEEIGLRNILLKGLGGVEIGDRCISVDATEAKLASGKRISKKEAREAGPSMESRVTMVGSLPAVLAAIRARS